MLLGGFLMGKKLYDLFISHAWRYSDEYDRLAQLLKKTKDIDVRIQSVYRYDVLNPANPGDRDLLLQLLEEQIKASQSVLVLARLYIMNRQWAQAIIELAQKHHKPVIGIKHQGHERVANELQQVVHKLVDWNSTEIIDSIKNLST
jgi:Thoeris protein ThsB, TIR-like domain